MNSYNPELPNPESRLSSLIFDYFAPQHLFIAEGEGACCILELLISTTNMPGQKAICYADTVRHQSPGYVDRLSLCRVHDFDVYATRLALLRSLPDHFALLSGQYRIYVAASAWLISAVEKIAKTVGIDSDRIMIEPCEPWALEVTCLVCRSQTTSAAVPVFDCPQCGSSLHVTSYYCMQTHTHLAAPVDRL